MNPELDLPMHFFETPEKWRAWLEKNYAQHDGIWLKFFKKKAEVPTMTYEQALDEALCFGWIDGQVKKFDEQSWVQRFTPRRAHSNWSLKNTENIERLQKLGKMHEAGQREVAAAKADGRWQAAYAGQKTAKPPEDFLEALAGSREASEFFESLTRAQRYAYYYRLQNAKTAETRENRIKLFITMLERGQALH
jgi:uncharacterized protein YdeI (YjbR/CyaY-like superfamily)